MKRDDIDIELREIDEDILDHLEDGRQTRQNLARLLDVTGEYVYQRVDLLIKIGVVSKIHDGFYELAERTGGDRDGDLPDEVAVYLDGLDVTTAERDAIEGMWRYVRDEAPVSPQDIRDNVFRDHSAGKESLDWWWKKLSEYLDGAPGVERTSQRRYEFVG